MTGKQLGPGKNHQRQCDSERRPHNQFFALGLCVAAENENKNDPKAHIGAGHHGSDEKTNGIVLERTHLALGKVGEMVDRFLVHQPSFRAPMVHGRWLICLRVTLSLGACITGSTHWGVPPFLYAPTAVWPLGLFEVWSISRQAD